MKKILTTILIILAVIIIFNVKKLAKADDPTDPVAQTELGDAYFYGKGVKQDYIKAVEYYYKAAQKGYVQAQINLGYCYQTGHGIKQNYDKANEWYCKTIGKKDFIPKTSEQKNLKKACLKIKHNY